MFINASKAIQVVIPAARQVPKRSGARSEARYPRTAKKRNPAMTRVVPISPVSSPTMAKMKSVCASGNHPYFSTEWPMPTPKNPPEARLYSACVD